MQSVKHGQNAKWTNMPRLFIADMSKAPWALLPSIGHGQLFPPHLPWHVAASYLGASAIRR